ncbi:MAG: aldo/keto reductase [Actinomycetales bacterium]
MSGADERTVRLGHGAVLPRLGFGTSPMNDRDAERAVTAAIEAGYRLVDTAENYGNEAGVGRAVRASGLPRDELFVTTKFNRRWHGADLVEQALTGSLERLGLDYVDLLLVHWPNPDQDRYVDAWRGLAGLLEEGRVRAIGMSNFKPTHIDRLLAETGVTPDLNQIQLNPFTTRDTSRQYDAEHGIVTQSWSPLGGRRANVLHDRTIQGVAERLGRTPAQVVLRWHLQLGLAVIPKSSDPGRIRSNADVWDFELGPDDMAAISGLDQGEGAATDSDAFGH